jgi:hypothetical protein
MMIKVHEQITRIEYELLSYGKQGSKIRVSQKLLCSQPSQSRLIWPVAGAKAVLRLCEQWRGQHQEGVFLGPDAKGQSGGHKNSPSDEP